jgi:hypothetical protein
MQTENHLEPSDGWAEAGVNAEEFARLQTLLEIVRQEQQRTEMSPERRAEIREHVLARVERYEVRRRRMRVLVKAASAMLFAGLVLTVIARTARG